MAASLRDAERAAYGEALRQEPKLNDTEPGAWLAIRLLPQDNDAKLARCRAYRDAFPTSPHRRELLLFILTEQTAAAQQLGNREQDRTKICLQAAREAADELLQKHPQIARVESGVWQLAESYAKMRDWATAIKLADQLLTSIPETARRPEVEAAIECWQKQIDDQDPPLAATVVANADQLNRVLTGLAKQRVIWLQLAKRDVDSEALKRLQAWVEAGGVLWLDTDLATAFKFPLQHYRDSTVQVLVEGETIHPVLAGLADGQPVDVAPGPDKYLIVGDLKVLRAKLTLLLRKDKGAGRAWVACAELKTAEPNAGHVVFRPRAFLKANTGAQQFEENLRAWSFRVAPRRAGPAAAQATPAADERRR